MKKYIILFLTTISLLSAQVDLKKIMERSWNGYSSTKRNLVVDGEENMTVSLTNLTYDTYYNTFRSDMKTTINLDGVKYSYNVKVNGTINTNDYSMTINKDYIIYEDRLPDGLVWVFNTIYATLYEDSDGNGYIIKGTFSIDGEVEIYG